MAKYLLLGDVHLSDRPPSSCTETYLDDLFHLLQQSIDLARVENCRAIIWAGDQFHHKTPGRSSHATVMRLIDLVNASGIKHYVVPGNHDLLNDRLVSLNESQPLGVVIASGAVELLHGWMGPTDDLDRTSFLDPVYGVPWLQRFDDDTVSAALYDYRSDPTENRHHLVVTHAPLYPPGQENPHEHYPTQQWAAAMDNEGSVYYGHIHEPHGVYRVDGVQFCNPGALSRGSLHEYNLDRTPSVAVWDSDTGQFDIRTLLAKPADQVFKLAEAQQKKETRLSADAFLASIRETRVATASVETLLHEIDGMQLGPELTDLLHDLLEQA